MEKTKEEIVKLLEEIKDKNTLEFIKLYIESIKNISNKKG